MCRFALYLGPPVRLSQLVTEPSNSIIHQSYDAQHRTEPLNGDGFGVAWYVPELQDDPAVFRSTSPAWNNHNLLNLAPVAVSHCLLAHVRAATPGLAITHLNCHPFQRNQFAFMHNGTIGGYAAIGRRLRDRLSDHAWHGIEGSTDSEVMLALIGDAWDASIETEPLARSVRKEAGVGESSFLNMALTDGQRAVVSRFVSSGPDEAHSLYYATGRLVVERGQGRVAPDGTGEPAVVVASEPLGPDDAWRAVPPNHLVLVGADRQVELAAL
jgi:predicted glutamine amidotransferase